MNLIPDEMSQELEKLISSLMIEMKIPGTSLGILFQNKVVYTKAFGARCLENNLPATIDTLWSLGSCSKSYCALAIMQLSEQGKLNVNDPISKYIPFKLKGFDGSPITIHHLLTHSSGIPNLGSGEILIDRWSLQDKSPHPHSTWDDVLNHVNGAQNEIFIAPGKKVIYLNEGYELLQLVIEKVSSMRYREYVTQNILEPLQMKRSTFDQDKFEKDADHFTGYTPRLDVAPHPFDEKIDAAGGLISSIPEQLNYLQMYLNGGIFDGKKIASSDSIKKMFESVVPSNLAANYMPSLGKEYYSYGWVIIENFQGVRIIAHLGSTGFSSSGLFMIPEKKIGTAMSSNTGSGQGLCFIVSLIIIAGFLGKEPTKAILIMEKMQMMGKLSGYYETYKGINKIKIEPRGNMLFAIPMGERVKIMEENEMPLIPETKMMDTMNFYIYSAPGATIPVEFMISDSGDISFLMERNLYHKICDFPPQWGG